MSVKREFLLTAVLSSLLLVLLITLVVLSKGSYQGGDTFQHFLIARYSPEHPHLLLDHWGKPVFTLLYALPASVGYTAAKIFTCLIGVTGAFMTFLCARELKQRNAFSMIVLMLFAPMYFIHLNSVMTEVLFSTWMITGVFLLLKEKWIAAALLLSFLPFVRTEGFVLLPFIAIWFAMHRQWKAFFLLATGTVIYSLIGFLFHYHDLLWVFTHNPYPAESPYGSGQWLHFIHSNKVIWGLPLFIAMCVGLFYLIWNSVAKQYENNKKKYWMLIVIPFFVFLIFHSIAWATGSLASNGEIRVMVCTMPFAALIAGYGMNELLCFIKSKSLQSAFVLLLLAVVAITPFQFFKMPLAKSERQLLIADACQFLKVKREYGSTHFVDPQIPVELEIDPYDPSIAQQWFGEKEHPENDMNPGDIVIWDAQFCPHEGGTLLSAFSENENFVLLKTFQPAQPIFIFDDEQYFVSIFECVK